MKKGIIKSLEKSKAGTLFGYIVPDTQIPNYDKDIIFFEDGLQQTAFSSLKPEMRVGFTLNQWNDKYLAQDIIPIEQPSKSTAINKTPVISLNKRIGKSKNKSSHKFFLEQLNTAFEQIADISDSSEFEDIVFSLLRLLGIHSVYQYPRESQAGRADGCFVLGNLIVMYDCTLRTYFEDYKEDQIDNYVNKLSNKGQLTVKIKKSDGGIGSKELQIKGKQRQVWIITKGNSREIRDYDGIRVKEIAIEDLIYIAMKRCKQLNYDIDILSNELFLLGM